MQRLIILTIFFFFSFNYSYGQFNEDAQEEFTIVAAQKSLAEAEQVTQEEANEPTSVPSFKDRIFFGGNVGLSFGDITAIEVSPLVGYQITENLTGGVGITYIYYDNKVFNYSTHTYGGRLFARYYYQLKEGVRLFPQVEYQMLKYEIRDNTTGIEYPNQWREAAYVGAGYSQRVGERSAVNIIGLYNLLYDEQTSLYNSPWEFRVEFNF
ncbi:hypothetical protein [Sediminitomix flava]|uniref:Outer membrane protein with beta-barrel domain n=1 Tax=Sediminitomix flava TaxID=379075 RepID=A0A316A143_SEDFL|nr:hypothetical protein [Sediminitomix flava]PWJ43377.1 hypothetical protein BC781_102937 [Sediminitomix flava]